MKCQVNKNGHFRHCILFAFNQGNTTVETARNICLVYGEDALNVRTVRRWFCRFRSGNFDLKDMERTGRRSDFDESQLNSLIKKDGLQTTPELAEHMNCSHMTVYRHLISMEKVQKFGSWVPRVLSEKQKSQRSAICAGLLARHGGTHGHKDRFLHRIITGDEKWCFYVNWKQRKEWVSADQQATPRPKRDLHSRKTMICVWWDWQGIIHYEILKRNQTVNAQLYVQQLKRLNEEIQRKRPDRSFGIILQHDNARPHVANVTKNAIETLGWDVLPHPPYSPDLAPSDFHLFQSLSNCLRGASFNNDVELRTWLDDFFMSRPNNFYARGFEKMVERWQEVINKEGDYIID